MVQDGDPDAVLGAGRLLALDVAQLMGPERGDVQDALAGSEGLLDRPSRLVGERGDQRADLVGDLLRGRVGHPAEQG